MLSAAMELTAYPWDEGLRLQATARSRSCGSAIEIGLAIDTAGNVSAIGIKSHACAIGQAAAALFAKSAVGQSPAALREARQSLARWLQEGGAQPAWPGISLLEPARSFPARHPAILLAWDAALSALGQ
ncbi:Fe-S cluster protein [Novosphingobium sp. AAP83]|nr:Fe-S cluster protein [Novosphingobium sp. AAP83]